MSAIGPLLVLTQLDYCNRVLAGLPASQLGRLQCVLHPAVRLIHGVCRHDHVAPLLQQLHWLSVPERVTFKLCVMVYRCLHGISPEYFSEDFRLVSEIYSRQRLRSASSTDVVVPATRRTPVFTWRPCIPGRRRSSMERATAQCHLCTISVLIPATPEDISIPAKNASITLITVLWSCSAYHSAPR